MGCLPLRPIPLRGLLSIFSKLAQIKPHSIGTTFQGENIIKTHQISLAWPMRASVYAVVVTVQTKALRAASSGYRKLSGGDDASYHLYQEEK